MVTSLARISVFNCVAVSSFNGKLVVFDENLENILTSSDQKRPTISVTCQTGQDQILVGMKERCDTIKLSMSRPIVSMDFEARKVYM